MSRKAFHIGIDLDIHAVSCPGVWLCPKGDAMLRVSMLGASAHTKRVEPSFPLLFHESFHFRKTFTGITSLAGLQAELTKRQIHIQLVQWQVHGCRCVLLAAFRSSLSELLYPQPATRGLVAGVDVDLLMETTACFPGIIAPKVEVSTKVVIEEMVNYPLHERDAVIINHKTLTSKRTKQKREDKTERKSKTKSTLSNGFRSRMRQKPVCHTRPSVRCYYCKQRVDRMRRARCRSAGEEQCECRAERADAGQDNTFYIPYCVKCGDVVEESKVKQGQIILKEGTQHGKWEAACPCAEPQRPKSACDCSLCRKYHNLFKGSDTSSPDSCLSQNSKAPRWKIDHSPTAKKVSDACCPCADSKLAGDVTRLRAGGGCSKSGRPFAAWDDDDSCEIQREPKDDEYRKILKADLDTHYKKLYERVSRRNNRRES